MCIFRSTKAKQQASHCAVCLCVSTKAEQQASNREAPPEHVEVERQKPERGLTFDMRGKHRLAGVCPLDGRVRPRVQALPQDRFVLTLGGTRIRRHSLQG